MLPEVFLNHADDVAISCIVLSSIRFSSARRPFPWEGDGTSARDGVSDLG